jgi:hypothetical protein
MKLIKAASLALLGVLAMGASSAKAVPTQGFLKLNVSMTVQSQALIDTNKNGDGKTYISTTQKQKVNNKIFLALLAEMFDTNWAAGAQLGYDLNRDQMIVADKTGTNVLFYCGDGVSNATRQAYVTLDWFNQDGPYSGKSVDATPGSGNFTGYWQGKIEIYYDNFSDASVFTDLQGDGLNVEKYSENHTTTSSTVSRDETFTPFSRGSAGGKDAIMTGKVTAKGKVTSNAP